MRESDVAISLKSVNVINLFAEDFIGHEAMPGMPPNREGTMQLFKMMHAAFPDMKWDAQDILVDGDKAVARVRFTGTNDGEFMGMPATERTFSDVHHMYIFAFRDGRIVEYRAVRDDVSLMRQLGAIPGPPAAR